ncbi:magnesium transporter NIPA-domain-containing protein [Mycena haematopus]|nr:magnesium transporter NIPA-domain-containing protein [Mycena haematopus]
MVDDKYIGLALAVSRSDRAADGTSASENLSYLRNPIWWAGMSTFANFAAYTFAPPVLVTPLGALSVLIGAVLASFLLNERMGHLGRVGCALCLIGSVIIVLHAPDDKEIETIVVFLEYALKPGFLLYCLTVCIGSVVLAYVVVPKHGRTNPVVYISIASIVGSVSVMFVKGFGLAVKLTFAGKNQFIYPSTYVFGLISVGCILIQLNYYNKALDIFSVNIVNPMYYVGFSSATIESAQALEESQGGVQLEGRLSLDGWHGIRRDSLSMGLPSPRGHGRRTSLYRTPTSTLFNAFSSDPAGGENVGLQRLEEDEDEWNEDADERTALRTPGPRMGRSPIQGHTPSRSLGHTPTRPVHSLSPPALGDIRISPRPV